RRDAPVHPLRPITVAETLTNSRGKAAGPRNRANENFAAKIHSELGLCSPPAAKSPHQSWRSDSEADLPQASLQSANPALRRKKFQPVSQVRADTSSRAKPRGAIVAEPPGLRNRPRSLGRSVFSDPNQSD